MFVKSIWLCGLLTILNRFVQAGSPDSTFYIPSYLSSVVSEKQSHIYFLSSPSNSSKDLILQSLNITASFNTSNAPLSDISHDLPFRWEHGSPSLAYATTGNGTLTIYIGDCHNSSAELWTYTPPNNQRDPPGLGSWDRFTINSTDDDAALIKGPPMYSSMISFPPDNGNSSPFEYYIFGGMCPVNQPNSIFESSPVVFSSNMTRLSLKDKNEGFEFGNVRHGVGLFSGAAFTMTGLLPLHSEPSNSTRRDIAYEQRFAVIGGQTQSWSDRPLFINMSTIGLFSLPDETWTFVDAQTDNQTLIQEFNISTIGPRSGHSAVVSPDGTKIVVVGGWIENTNTAAQPQVAILDVGKDYGGNGEWTWRAVGNEGSMFEHGGGIYGHAATILPGGSMLVAGGYQISGRNDSKHGQPSKRSELSPQFFIFDFDSESWTSHYDSPRKSAPPAAPKPSSENNSGPLSSPGQKAGLAIGLAVAVLLMLIVLVYYLRKRRRRAPVRELKHEQLISVTEQAQNPQPPSAFTDYGGRTHLTPSPTETVPDWSSRHPRYSQGGSYVDSEGTSSGYSRPVAVAGLGRTETGTPRGLGLPSSLVLGDSTGSEDDEHDGHNSADCFGGFPVAKIGHQRESDGSQVAEPLLMRERQRGERKSLSKNAKGKERAPGDVSGHYQQVPAHDSIASDDGDLGNLFAGDRRVTGVSNASSSDGIGAFNRTTSDWSEVSDYTQSTARTHPLFARAIGNVLTAFASNSDPSFSRQATARYEPYRGVNPNQPNAARSFPNITSQPYVSLIRDCEAADGTNFTVQPAPQFAVLANRGRSDSQPKSVKQPENVSGVMGNVAQLMGPVRKAHHVGDPQSVEPETTSLPERSSTGQTSLSNRSATKRYSANDIMAMNPDSPQSRPRPRSSLNQSQSRAERISDVASEASFNSMNMPDDWKIETAFRGKVIDTPSRLRLVDSRPVSQKESRSVRTQNSQLLDPNRQNGLSRANSRS
ncbi:Galactose oxidase/kelch, beta-propeller [Ascosphaera apis ARSEF 7405]|uniref:Galactose oxidase/kelch, beta-propeller n=1 Tax=Ascosphaera apis ARSEF 7405 TaxID=392613 RepID=A0A166PIB6_9EURO|nr:Galactose oxidase/kelch, beta-propeller [Ascosphaera apis ARSEF 7405]